MTSSLRTILQAVCACGAAWVAVGCVVTSANPHGLGSVKTAETASARAATARGDWRAAACSWFAIFEAGGDSSRVACVETARALCELGDPQSANGVIEQGLARHPGDPELLEMHGDVLCRLGFRRAAEESYLQALEADSERASTLLALGRLRVELGMENAALVPLQRRVELGYADAQTHELLARVHTSLGNAALAFGALERCIELDGATPDRAVAAAKLFVEDRELRRDTRAEAFVGACLARAIETAPQDTRAHYYAGMLAEGRGDDTAAIEHYRRAIETDPLCVATLTRLAELHARRGEHERAAEMARRALELEKDAERRTVLEGLLAAPAAPLANG